MIVLTSSFVIRLLALSLIIIFSLF